MIWKRYTDGKYDSISNGKVRIYYDILDLPNKFDLCYTLYLDNFLVAELDYPENTIE